MRRHWIARSGCPVVLAGSGARPAHARPSKRRARARATGIGGRLGFDVAAHLNEEGRTRAVSTLGQCLQLRIGQTSDRCRLGLGLLVELGGVKKGSDQGRTLPKGPERWKGAPRSGVGLSAHTEWDWAWCM